MKPCFTSNEVYLDFDNACESWLRGVPLFRRNKKFVTAYIALVMAPLLVLGAILKSGHTTPVSPSLHALTPDLFLLVLQITVILFVSRVTGTLFQIVHQPRVVGEMCAGIFLGPSVFGWIAPDLCARLFPSSSIGILTALSQIGLLIFMFLVGLGMNLQELKRAGNLTLLTSHASITVPFVLGSLLSVFLYPRLSDSSVSFVSFSLFMGSAMSITAFPVLARILRELHLLHTRVGTAAIACAAVDDVTGWCILAYIVVLVRSGHSGIGPWFVLLGVACFTVVMVYCVRPQLRRLEAMYAKRGELTDGALAFVLLLVLLSALCTEGLGIHLLFGAFLAGAIMPRNKQLIRYLFDRFEPVTVALLLPLFFAATGLRTSIGLLKSGEMWMYCGAIILVATAGKWGGSMLASMSSGLRWREAAGLGALMNTRGMMELVILNLGLDIKVISQTLFSMMVLMAVVTTLMTTPALRFIYRGCPAGNADPDTTGEQMQPAVRAANATAG